jgi:small-conductance mechanosensitive channel
MLALMTEVDPVPDVLSNIWPPGATEALVAVLIGGVLGWIADQLLYRFINSRAAEKGWSTGRQLAKGLHGLLTATGLIVGAAVGYNRLMLAPGRTETVREVLNVATILVLTAFGARILGRLVRGYTEREGSRLPSTSIFVNLARGIVWVIGGISVLAALGVSIAPLITALGVGGLAVGLALQPTLENVFSGIQVLAARQIEPGDLIRLETGEEGAVIDVTWRNTTILTPSDDVVIVPNSVLGRAIITNFTTGSCEHVVVVPVTVSTTADPATVERLARAVATEVVTEVEGAVPEQEPTVRFATSGPAGLQINAAIRVRSYPDRLPVRHEYLKRLQVRLIAEGIEAPLVAAPLRNDA